MPPVPLRTATLIWAGLAFCDLAALPPLPLPELPLSEPSRLVAAQGGSRAEDQHRRDDRDDPAAAAEAIPEGRLGQSGPLHAPLLAVGQHPELGRAFFGDDLADLANLGIPL